MSSAPFALFLNGSYGAGKSAALEHVGDLLAEREIPFSLMDVDWFHRSWPVAPHDVDNTLVEAENMAQVWTNYQQSGPRQVIVSGVLVSPADHARYASALGLPVRSVRLAVTPRVAEARLRSRYGGSRPSHLSWHLERHEALAREIERAGLDELVIETDELLPLEVARLTLSHFGPIGPAAS